MVCVRCGHSNPAVDAARCERCGAFPPRTLVDPLLAEPGDGGDAAPDTDALHAARTLLVHEDLVEEFRLQTAKPRRDVPPPPSPPSPGSGPRPKARRPKQRCQARPPASARAASPPPARAAAPLPSRPAAPEAPAGQPSAQMQARGPTDIPSGDSVDRLLLPPPVPVPPGEPGPWTVPTDQPRPIRPMRRAAAERPTAEGERAALGPAALRSVGGEGEGEERAQGSGAAKGRVSGARLLLEDHAGDVLEEVELRLGATRLGRTEGEVLFPEDPFMAPLHAWLLVDTRGARVYDPGSTNGVFLHTTRPCTLADGDAILVGSQLLLFRDRWARRGAKDEQVQFFGSAGWDNPLRLVNLRMGGDVVLVHVLDGDLIIGREGASPYRGDRFLARRHLSVELTAEGVELKDISDGRGYFRRVYGEAPLPDRSLFQIGSKRLRLRLRRKPPDG